MTAKALVIDDEVDLCRLMQLTLMKMGIQCDLAYDINTAFEYINNNTYNFCLTDLRLPDGSGLDVVRHIAKTQPSTPVAVITAHGSMDLAIEALKLGAFDFVNKPLELPRLRQLIEHALKVAEQIEDDPKPTQKSAVEIILDKHLVGQSTAIQQLKATIVKLARSQAPVFLWGASGTGKEVVAKLIHELSPRREGSFVAVNCGAIPAELMESEFFGHKKGSFTGATTDKIGLFQQADGGTLFLDEVADLPLAMQVKLLRAIQEKSVRAIGDTKESPVDIRLLSATHKNLNHLVQQGLFRQDLFYRINVIELKLPTLNERDDDIELLANYFLEKISEDWQIEETLTLSESALTALRHHQYEGNVRELRNLLERAITLAESTVIDAKHLGLDKLSHTENTHPKITSTSTDDVTKDIPELNANNNKPIINNNAGNTPTQVSNNNKIVEPNTSAFSYSNFSQGASQVTANFTSNPISSITEENNPTNTTQQPTTSSSDITDDEQRLAKHATNKESNQQSTTSLPDEGLEAYLQTKEKQMIMVALEKTQGNKTKAAQLLGTSFRSLRYRMKKLGIDSSNYEGDNDDE
ncbi:sigma-54-dependent transcriptional regulator [Psychrobacter sp. I-STPA10]|uniref:sigma-54-dependent transcriptional regulator n=1 Tax=Psychrobacter sp. I-STPA10 TaxID=2585769 RepID=UPI001E5B4DD8|nr:sigma-54 dependent transcriptional regulator [Psychrobacter sp. I-STPA10]